MIKILKTTVFNKFFISFLLIYLSCFPVYSDSYDNAVKSLKNGNTEKSLSYFYKYIKTESASPEKISDSLDKILKYEKDVDKIIISVKDSIKRVKNNKQKSSILRDAAEISELSGKTETAVEFYLSSYNEYPDPSNSSSLLISSRILMDNGEFTKALKQIIFYKTLPLDSNSIYRADIIESMINILSGNKSEGENILQKLTSKKDISSENLAAVLLISDKYNLNTPSEQAKKRLEEKEDISDIKALLSYSSMISPAVYLNYSLISPDNNTVENTASDNTGSLIFLQTGSYSSRTNADKMAERLSAIGFNVNVRESDYKGRKIYKVLIPAESREKAEEYHIKLKEHSIESFMVFK